MSGRLLATDERLTGEVLGVVYADEDRGFGVIELAADTGRGVRCVGPLADLSEGQTVTLTGVFRDHPRYGRTFEAAYYEQVAPTTAAGLRAFLFTERFADVPLARREAALQVFGDQTGEVIEHEPARLVREAGLDADEAAALHERWMSGQALAALVRLVAPAHWPMDAIRAAHAAFGASVVTICQDDPYRLIGVERVGFGNLDALARHLGIGARDPRRLRAGARAALTEARQRDGHQHLERDLLTRAGAQLLQVEPVVAASGIDAAITEGLLATDSVDQVEVVSTPEALRTEQRLALGIARLAATEQSRARHVADRLEPAPSLTRGQQEAVTAAFTHPVSVLTGGPGTGKTRTIEEIVHAAERAGLEVALCAPTGRAAKRMEEVVGRQASTVHRLLEARPTGNGGFVFRYGIEEQLPHDLIIVDEVSMCDTWLAHRLVAAVDDGTHLVLVGDPDQLPSVGPGDVLRDLVRTEVLPSTALTEIHRQAADSRIVGLAREILAGEVGALPGVNGDVFVAEEPRRDRIVDRVVQAVAVKAPDYFDVEVDQVQVLAPMYRGPVGVDALNAALKAALNPAANLPDVAGFHVGDRVMQTRNDPELDVANGDVGTVVDLDRRGGTLRVLFPRGEVTCTREQARRLTLAWAVTVHKSQGGEWPVTVLVVDRSHRSMLWRNLVYTAVTRASRALIVVGQGEMVRAAARQDRPSNRSTGLAWRIRQAMPASVADTTLVTDAVPATDRRPDG